MKKKTAKRLMAASMAGTMAMTMLAGFTSSADEASDKPDTWIADRTITVQAYVDDIGNTLPSDFNNTETMKKITELTGIKLDVRYTPGDSDSKVLASQLASGTIPDVIISYLDNSTRPEFPLLYKAAKDGMFADVSEYMKNGKVYSKYYEDGYLPDDTKKNIVFRDDLDGVYLWQLNIDEIDRSLEYDPDEEYVGGMYIQKSIADDLGIDPTAINTQDDFYDLLVKIKEGGYKDDNGNDVYPLGPLNDISGDNKEVVRGKSGRGCMAISADAENPEEIFQFFDWLSTKEGQIIAQYGAEGVSYTMEDGYPRLTDEVAEKLNAGDTDYLINTIGAGFGGSGNYFFEFVLTNKNNKDNFGESRPGASSGNSAFARSVQIAKDYPVEKKLVSGLNATAYMSVDELADVKMQMDLLDWDETFVQACFAKSDDEVKSIVESFRNQLAAAGIDRFEAYVKSVYEEDPNAVNFYD